MKGVEMYLNYTTDICRTTISQAMGYLLTFIVSHALAPIQQFTPEPLRHTRLADDLSNVPTAIDHEPGDFEMLVPPINVREFLQLLHRCTPPRSLAGPLGKHMRPGCSAGAYSIRLLYSCSKLRRS